GSNSSVSRIGSSFALCPPAVTRTRPSRRSVALACRRRKLIGAAQFHFQSPSVRSRIAAEFVASRFHRLPRDPPMAKIRASYALGRSGRRTELPSNRFVGASATRDHFRVLGSNSRVNRSGPTRRRLPDGIRWTLG